MNIICLVLGHKFPEGASVHYIGIGYERDVWKCQRKGCKKELSIKTPTRWSGVSPSGVQQGEQK